MTLNQHVAARMRQAVLAERILSNAIQLHKPSLVILSFSGGYDSMVSSHIAAQWARRYAHSTNVMTASVDTLISADGWRTFVTETARSLRLPRFAIHETDHFEKWTERMIESGYVFRKSQHRINFYYLKQVVFRSIIRDNKKHYTDRIMFVNGVRRAESKDRANAPEIARQGAGVFVNPIVHWDDEAVHKYRMLHDMPTNPFYDSIGNSGDCLCNWHTHNSLTQVKQYAPKTAAIIEPIHIACRAAWGYGYGEEPLPGTFNGTPQLVLPGFEETPNLCAGCAKPAVSNAAIEDAILSRMDWTS